MVTLSSLMTAPELKEITITAGSAGMVRPIKGINVTESLELTEFYRPNELLVTTGLYMAGYPDKLLEMVKIAFQHRAAGIVFNLGPYIPAIPEAVLSFAEEHQFPVFQMPWKYRIADFLRSAIRLLSSTQTKKSKHEQILSALLFPNHFNEEWAAEELSQTGFKKTAEFGVIICMTDNHDVNVTSFSRVIEGEFSRRYRHYLSMFYENQIIYLIDRAEILTPSVPFSKTAENIQKKATNLTSDAKLYLGMGNFYKKIEQIAKSFEEAKAVISLAQKHENPFMYKYKDIGAYKIIMAVHDESIIKNFHEDMIGLLYRYDQLHHTDYVRFLRIFLEEDGSTANISRKEFIHRNTVLYKAKKIEALLDVDLDHPFTKTNLNLAFMIEDILK